MKMKRYELFSLSDRVYNWGFLVCFVVLAVNLFAFNLGNRKMSGLLRFSFLNSQNENMSF